MFSSSLASSAASGEETGTTGRRRSSTAPRARSRHAGVEAADHLGRRPHGEVGAAGVDPLGRHSQVEVPPGASPSRSSIGCSTSAWCPGRWSTRAPPAGRGAGRADRLGGADDDRDVRLAVLGQRRGHADQDRLGVRDRRVVRRWQRSSPPGRAAPARRPATSSTCVRPAASSATRAASTSTQVTRQPASAKATASGSPT